MGTGIVEHLEQSRLHSAFRGEVEAMATVRRLEARLASAQLALTACRATREHLPCRAASDPSVNSVDVRKAVAALADAEAEVWLLTNAIPHAVALARCAVHGAHSAAKAAAERMPGATAEELDAFFERHGRDRSVAERVARLRETAA